MSGGTYSNTRIIKPDFKDIKTFLERTVQEQKLYDADFLIGVYYGASAPAIILKHTINKIRRQEGQKEIPLYPMRIRTNTDDGIGSNSIDTQAELEYFIEPKDLEKKDLRIVLVEDIIAYGKTIDLALKTIDDFCARIGSNSAVDIVSIVLNRDKYFTRNDSTPRNLTTLMETGSSDWVIFPWEADP